MKYILIILICFLGIAGYSQPITNRANSITTVQDARLKALLNLYIPLYLDTTQANTNKGLDTTGAIIYTYTDNILWYRTVFKGWVSLSSSGGSSVNIYNSDGELTGNRTLKGDNLNLLFDSLAIGTLMSRGNSSTDSSFLTVDNTNNLATQVGYNSGGATSLVSVEPSLATLEHTNNGLISSFQANQSGQAGIRADDKLSLITNGSGGFEIQSTNAQPIVFQREGGGSVYLFTNTNVNSLFRVNSSTARFIDTSNNKYIDIVPNSAGVAINLTGSAPLFINNQSVGANTINTNAQTINGDNVAQNSTRNAVVLSEWRSTTKGLLFPRMTGAQMNAIISPPTGMIVQCTDSSNSPICYYTGSGWRKFLSQTGGNATLTGVINVTVDTVTNSICTQFADSSVSCYPLSGDSVRVVGDTSICVYTNGSSDCFVSVGDTFVTAGGIDSVTIIGNVFCIWSVGSSDCVNINNSNGFVTTATLNADSTAYDFYSGGTYLFSLPTLLRSLYAGSGILINDTTIDGRATTVIYNIGGSGGGTLQDAFDAAPIADPQINIVEGGDLDRKMMQSQYFGQNISFGFNAGNGYILNRSESGGTENIIRAEPQTLYLGTNDSTGANTQYSMSVGLVNQNVKGSGDIKTFLIQDTAKIYEYNNDSTIRHGINTTTPQAALHVVGDGSITAAFMNGNVGIGTTTPDSAVTNELGLWSKRGVRFSGLSTTGFDTTNNKAVVVNSSGTLSKMNWPAGGGGALDSTNLLTTTATRTVKGSITFNNTTTGTANTIVTGGVQGGSDNVGLLINGTYAGATNAHSLRIAPAFAPTSNGFAMAAVDAPISTSGTANIDHLVNFQGAAVHASSGTLTHLYNSYYGFANNGGVTTNRYGSYVANASGSGTITNQYMYYAEDPLKGGTLNYAYFAAGAGKLGLTSGAAELGGNVIVGFGTGTAAGATMEIRKNAAASLRMRNNANWFQFTQPSGSADISFGSISGNMIKYYDNGTQTIFAAGQDSVSNSGLWVNRSFATAYLSSTSSSITITSNHYTINADATSNTITATLPTAVGCKGRLYVIRKSDSGGNLVTVATTSSQTINGATTYTGLTAQYKTVQVQSDGANWMIISAF